jgi:hypothetical protein
MRSLIRYIADLFQGWIGSMSSTFSVAFLVGAFIWKWAEKGQLRYWLVASFICYFIAAFNAWYKIHPDLRIGQTGISLSKELGQSVSDGVLFYDVTIHLRIINTTSRENTLQDCTLTIFFDNEPMGVAGRAIFTKDGSFMGNLMAADRFVFKQGLVQAAWVTFRFPDNSADLSLDICGLKYALAFRDAYGRSYRVWGKIPANENPMLPGATTQVPLSEKLRLTIDKRRHSIRLIRKRLRLLRF